MIYGKINMYARKSCRMSSFCRINEKKSEIRSKTMLKLDSIKAEIPAIRPVLAEVGDSL